MFVLAIAVKEHEYMYNPRTAHKVSKASAAKIRDVLNEKRYILKDNQVWHIFEVDEYDAGYFYAEKQKFTVCKGIVKRRFCA